MNTRMTGKNSMKIVTWKRRFLQSLKHGRFAIDPKNVTIYIQALLKAILIKVIMSVI